jgi:diguanylate cyclase (GGDEF)-like protein
MLKLDWERFLQAAQQRRNIHLYALPFWIVGTGLRVYLGTALTRSWFDVVILPYLAAAFMLLFLLLLLRRISVFYLEVILLLLFVVALDGSLLFHMTMPDLDFAVKKVISYSFWSIAIYSMLFWMMPRRLAVRMALIHDLFILAATTIIFAQLPPAQQQVELLVNLAQLHISTILFIGVFSQYTQMIEARQTVEQQLLTKVYTDELTQLANRRALDLVLAQQVDRAANQGQGFAIILIDIDHFKRVNDTFGHILGDLVLRQFAALLRATLVEPQVVGRWGGEEFIAIVPCTTPARAAQLAAQMCATVAAANFEPVWRVTASFGVTGYWAGDTVTSILERADHALYQAKTDGRNRVVLVDEPSTSPGEEHSIVQGLLINEPQEGVNEAGIKVAAGPGADIGADFLTRPTTAVGTV